MTNDDRYSPPTRNRIEPTADTTSPSSWLERNWKWFVPLGCGGALVLFVAFAATILGFLFWLIRSNEAYIEALERVRTSPAVIEELGEPIEPGFWIGGSVHSSGPSGEADLMFPIAGPDGSGTVYLQATKSAGFWSFERLEVEVEERNGRIDLLQPESAH